MTIDPHEMSHVDWLGLAPADWSVLSNVAMIAGVLIALFAGIIALRTYLSANRMANNEHMHSLFRDYLRTQFEIELGLMALGKGRDRRLVSVREVKDGRLIITTYTEGTWAFHNGRPQLILSFKHTIHPSKQSASGANTVHATTEFEDGTTESRFLLTHAARDGRFQPIYIRRLLNPRLLRPFQPHERDTIINLASFNPSRNNLVYALWFSSAQAADQFPRHPSYSLVVHRFSRFCIAIPYAFTHEASHRYGAYLHMITSTDEHISEEERQLGHQAGPAAGGAPSAVLGAVIHFFNRVLRIPVQPGPWLQAKQQDTGSIPVEGPPLFLPRPKP